MAAHGWSFQLRIVLLICTWYLAARGHPTQERDLGIHQVQTRSQRYCGEELPEMLSLLCQGEYNGPPGKRDGLESIFKEDDPFLPRKMALSMLKRSYRRLHGAYDECCKKPCHVREMLGYCSRTPGFN